MIDAMRSEAEVVLRIRVGKFRIASACSKPNKQSRPNPSVFKIECNRIQIEIKAEAEAEAESNRGMQGKVSGLMTNRIDGQREGVTGLLAAESKHRPAS